MRKIIFIFSILLFLFCSGYFYYWGIFRPIHFTHGGVKVLLLLSELKYNDVLLPFLVGVILCLILPSFFVIAGFKFMRNKTGKQRWPRIYLTICFSLIMLVFLALAWSESLIMNGVGVVIICIIFIILGYPIWYLIKAKER